MFRAMRREKKLLDVKLTNELLEGGDHGVLSTIGEEGYPYGVPVNYFYDGTDLYVHCAKVGQKLDNIKYSDKVSFCVVSEAEIVSDKFSTNFKSIILFGRAFEATEEEKIMSLTGLIEKYSPEFIKEGKKYIERAAKNTHVIKIVIDHITGKGNRE